MSEDVNDLANGAAPQNGSATLPVHVEVLEARPVETGSGGIEPTRRLALAPPLIAATGGLILGIVTFVVARILRRPRRGRRISLGSSRRRRGMPEVQGSRSFLVDVHLLKRD